MWEKFRVGGICIGGNPCRRNPMQEESHGGGIPCRRNPIGKNPVQEESFLRNPVWKESRGMESC